MKKRFRNLLPWFVIPKEVFTGSKLSLKFKTKNKTIFNYNHDVIYYGNCPENGCPKNYVRKAARRISHRVLNHTGKDIDSCLYKYTTETGRKR